MFKLEERNYLVSFLRSRENTTETIALTGLIHTNQVLDKFRLKQLRDLITPLIDTLSEEEKRDRWVSNISTGDRYPYITCHRLSLLYGVLATIHINLQ